MRVFNLVLLVFFAVSSFSDDMLKIQNLDDELDNVNLLPEGKKWVVLVAGSRGWSNYRHQADICHAYQIMRRNGIPEENIITMMVDDIAYNYRNPSPGKIINRPNGTDVYEGVVIDYKGTNVTKSNFLNIITGNKLAMQSIGSGKVVEGGPADSIFINFVDHGATGIFSFPHEYLYADQLNDALNTMHENSKYRKMLLYIEACNAGSMFDGILKDNTGILAITASAPREYSYGCYCLSQSGRHRTCLGDLFSVTWMEYLDAKINDISAIKKTIFSHFKEIRTNVTDSNVMAYGDYNIGNEKLSSFIRYRQPVSPFHRTSKSIISKITTSDRDAYRNSLQYQMTDNKMTDLQKIELIKELHRNNEMRVSIDRVFQNIYTRVVKAKPDIKVQIGELHQPKNLNLTLDIFPCYRSILDKITESCFSLPRNPYTMNRLTFFANLCIIDNTINEAVKILIEKSCSLVPKNIDNVF